MSNEELEKIHVDELVRKIIEEPSNPINYTRLSNVYLMHQDYDNAFEWFRKAAENGHEKAEELFKKYDFKN